MALKVLRVTFQAHYALRLGQLGINGVIFTLKVE